MDSSASGMACKGCQNVIKIIPDVLKFEDAYNIVGSPSCGAISLFAGTTRDHFEGKKVARLEYEAYVPMAEKEIENICTDIRSKWQVEHIAVFHRLGLVKIGEASVIIAISSNHRKESLEAVQYCIDKLKEMVPIWKKEVYEDGNSDWKANIECDWST
ncbi:molybdopterin synthase catalytic subunit-like isoform X3 [Anneissia japonica]|uniref:molybdopterin synthase catalytic subunit-like isoform X3 n=1 Tax=Anneissia japonica TaxID=1529436 RepID=UPI0014259CD6|nr:molybdopterin synthase catalytic subunit-like isoform X3 [Anneissia japonica]